MNYNLKELASEFLDTSDKIIPVLGDGVMYYRDENNVSIPLLQYVVKRFREDNPQVLTPGNSSSDLFTLTCFYHAIKKSTAFEGAYKRYIKEARERHMIHIDPVVLEFITTYKFPLIITTSCFSYLEEAINKNLTANKYISVSYNPKVDNSLPISNAVYHLFGNAEEKFSDWVSNEDVLLDFLHGLHSIDFTCKNLCEYINKTKSSMMILGCGLPDWLFRFLWYSIGYPEKNRDGYWLNDNLNIELQHFLENISYSPVQTVDEFLTTTTKLKQSELEKEVSSERIVEYDFFISYAGEDDLIAKRLYENLVASGYKVWYDSRGDSKIKSGQNYVKKFSEGILMSKKAITIITEHYLRGVQDTRRPLCDETRLIKQKALDYLKDDKDNYFCIPVLIDGRTFNNKKLTTSAVEEWAGYVSSVEGGLDVLFKNMNMEITDENNPQLLNI